MRRAFGPVELAAFRAIKRAFDPDGLLNPGVMLPPPAAEEPELTTFSEAVRMALAGGARVFPPPGADRPRDTIVEVDAENMSLTAGCAAICRDVAAAARATGLSCPATVWWRTSSRAPDIASRRDELFWALKPRCPEDTARHSVARR
jgi:glycolate dehydrogenase FAD-linked subunit